MALIRCEECNAEISDKAAACVRCGAPTAAAAAIGSTTGVVTTQQTGKTFKALQFMGVILILVGVVSCVGKEATATGWLWTIGLAMWIFGRFGGWWKHG